jgi:arylsulfatase A
VVCLTDLLATCAGLVGAELPADAGENRVSILPLLKGGGEAVRESVVHHSVSGDFAIRQGKWKLVLCAGSGGWSRPTDAEAVKQGLAGTQLYGMSTDEGETRNLQAEYPEVVARLTQRLEEQIARGRSTPGAKQANDGRIDLRKAP